MSKRKILCIERRKSIGIYKLYTIFAAVSFAQYKDTMENYMNISALLIGISTAFFAIIAIYILFWHKERTRYQTVLGWIMTIWALTNLKDIILTFPGMYTPEILNWIMIIDGWGAMTYTIILFEVVMPRWTTPKRLALLSLPFALFTLLYIIWPVMEVIYSYAAFLWCFAWSIVIIGWIKVRRRISYVRENFSNIDRIDLAEARILLRHSESADVAYYVAHRYGSHGHHILRLNTYTVDYGAALQLELLPHPNGAVHGEVHRREEEQRVGDRGRSAGTHYGATTAVYE